MRSSLWLALLVAACATRGTDPNSIEVGGSCDPNGSFNGCEESCSQALKMCVFACKTDADCPPGSACASLASPDSTGNFTCLPLCDEVACKAYTQDLCCVTMENSLGSNQVNVCYPTSLAAGACNGL